MLCSRALLLGNADVVIEWGIEFASCLRAGQKTIGAGEGNSAVF